MSRTASSSAKAESRYSWSIRLTVAGLVVELGSLFGLHHPLGFMIFAILGCSLVAAGVVLFVVALFSIVPDAAEASE